MNDTERVEPVTGQESYGPENFDNTNSDIYKELMILESLKRYNDSTLRINFIYDG